MISRRCFLNWMGMGTAAASIGFLGPLVKHVIAEGMAKVIKVFSYSEGGYVTTETVEKTPQEWKKILTPEQFRVLREMGTENSFSGALWDNKEPGIYRCAGCDLDLFSSEHKYDSHTGWPSFWQPIAPENIVKEDQRKFIFIHNVEVHCVRCGGHQGHIFDDGPPPTGLRYCINSVSLKFVPKEEI